MKKLFLHWTKANISFIILNDVDQKGGDSNGQRSKMG